MELERDLKTRSLEIPLDSRHYDYVRSQRSRNLESEIWKLEARCY